MRLEGEDGGPIELAPDSVVLWTRLVTLLLINQCRENEEFVTCTSGKLRYKEVWNKIAATLKTKRKMQFQCSTSGREMENFDARIEECQRPQQKKWDREKKSPL